MGKRHGKRSKRGSDTSAVCTRTMANVTDGFGVKATVDVKHFPLVVCIWLHCILLHRFMSTF